MTRPVRLPPKKEAKVPCPKITIKIPNTTPRDTKVLRKFTATEGLNLSCVQKNAGISGYRGMPLDKFRKMFKSINLGRLFENDKLKVGETYNLPQDK